MFVKELHDSICSYQLLLRSIFSYNFKLSEMNQRCLCLTVSLSLSAFSSSSILLCSPFISPSYISNIERIQGVATWLIL